MRALQREFNDLDVDGSGNISLVEINQMPKARVTSIISMAVNALYAVCDVDGDHIISPDELAHARLAAHLDSSKASRVSNDEEDEGGGMYPDDYHDEF